MIQFEKFTLSNGLRLIVHEDPSTPMAVVNMLYDVGAKDENPEKTGFAHLFEHLMFGGSVNIPVFDEPLQLAGGESQYPRIRRAAATGRWRKQRVHHQ
jgi:zinc protease